MVKVIRLVCFQFYAILQSHSSLVFLHTKNTKMKNKNPNVSLGFSL